MATIYKNRNVRWEEPEVPSFEAVFNIMRNEMPKKKVKAAKKKIKIPKKGKKKKIFKKKMDVVMGEFKEGDLNIGKSKKKVKNRKQAIAIALSESKKATKKKGK